MLRIRSLVERVRRLEQTVSPRSPIEQMYGGSLEAWEAEVQQGIEAGKLCHMDAPVVLACIQRWHREGAWRMWGRRGQVWDYGGQR